MRTRLAIGLALIVLLAAVFWGLHEHGLLETIGSREAIVELVARLGPWGPVAIIGLMTLAILFSPLPSAPIALAAGAAYGHAWGTLYVVIGSEIGAMAAFGLARLLGHDALRKWFGDRLSMGLIGSQRVLMLIVFASRLLPFVSFDLVSYAAGLTVLSFWRFALATLAGIIPASFLLAHFGSEFVSGETDRIMISVVLLGGITLLPLVFRRVRAMFQPGEPTPGDGENGRSAAVGTTPDPDA